MVSIKEFNVFLNKAAVLRYHNYKEWYKNITSAKLESSYWNSDDAWQEEYTRQSLYWASHLKKYLEEIEPELRDTSLPDEFFELKNTHAIKELANYIMRNPARDNLAGLARLYHYASEQQRQEIKKVFLESLPLEEALSLLAARKSRERGNKELLRELIQEKFNFTSFRDTERTNNIPDVPITELGRFFPYLDLEEQILLLKQYAGQPEKVTELFHQLRRDHQEVTCFVTVADILSPQDIENIAKGLKWSRRYKERLQAIVSPKAWEALLEARSLKVTHKIEILQLLGDGIQTKAAILRDCLQAEPKVAIQAALLANKYLPQLLTSRRDLMHRIAGELCNENKIIDGDTLTLLATLIKSEIVQEQDLSNQQRETLLKLAGIKKYKPIIIEILTTFIKSTTREANISSFIQQLGIQLVKLGEQQVINDAWSPYVKCFKDDQIKTLINEFPGIDLNKTLKEELIKRNLLQRGYLPEDDKWQPLDLDSTARFVHEAFLKTVEIAVNLTYTLNELAYHHLPTEDWLKQLPENHRAIFNTLMLSPLQELIRKSGEIGKYGKEMINKQWEKIWDEINTFAREVEARSQAKNETDEVSRYLRRYLQGYLKAISKLETLFRSELDQRIMDLHESVQVEASPFIRYQKIKFHYNILQSYLDSLEESIIKDVGRHTNRQFEDFFIYLSDAGIPEVSFDQMYLGLLASLGLAPVETRRGAKVKFNPMRHQHLRLESPEVCIICTYGVVYRDSIICPATVV